MTGKKRLATLLGAGREIFKVIVEKSTKIKFGDNIAVKLENEVNIVRIGTCTIIFCRKNCPMSRHVFKTKLDMPSY